MAQKQYRATLKRGGVYVVGDRRFDRDVPEIIDEATKLRLEKYAVDARTVQMGDDQPAEQVFHQKFDIEEIVEPSKAESVKAESGEPTPRSTPRSRSQSPATE